MPAPALPAFAIRQFTTADSESEIVDLETDNAETTRFGPLTLKDTDAVLFAVLDSGKAPVTLSVHISV